MTKMHVRNITGLPAVLDKFDDFARQTVVRAMADAGITVVSGSFEQGAVVTTTSEGVYQESTGKVFSWFTDATITVPAGTTPQNFGGVNATAWVDRTGLTLRSEINITQKRFACVADMVADTSLYIGQIVETLSYYNGWAGTAIKPIGGNQYEIVAASTGTEDGGSFITLSNGLQAKGVFPYDTITDAQFGAKIDGVTDDIIPITNALAFTKRLKLERGNRVISSPIYYTNHEIYGEGAPTLTVIIPSAKFSAFKYNGAFLNGGKIKGIMIDFGSTVPVLADSSIGIDYGASTDTTWPARYSVEDVYIRGATRAVQDDTGAWSGSYKKVWAQNCRLAFSKRAGTMTVFEQCYSDACLQAWLCVNAHTVSLKNCAADSWNTDNGVIIDFKNCPSFEVNGLQVEAGTITNNGIFLRAYGNSNGKVDGVNVYALTHNIAAAGIGSVIYAYGEDTNISIAGLTINGTTGISGSSGTLRFLAALARAKITVKASYLGAISGGSGVISSGYTDSGSTIILDETVECEVGFTSGSDVRWGQIYWRNGLKTISSLVLAAGASIQYQVPLPGLLSGDMVIATPTFASQGEMINARYYNSGFASIIIFNPTVSPLTLTGNIYVQAIRHFETNL